MPSDEHKNFRDEQFWFTATAVGFNGLLLARVEVSALYAVISAALVSLFAMYLVLSRWVAAAGRQPDFPPNAQKDSWSKRLSYTAREVRAAFKSLAYVLAEFSGSFFYLLIILMGFLGVMWKHWHRLFYSCSICLLVLISQHSYGQIYLTGVLQHGTGTNGQTVGSPVWNTLGNEASFANIYLTQPNAGYTASFLNFGNGAGASVSYGLTPGTYQFYFFTMGFWDNNPGQYGLNLFFNGDNTHPGIAAYSPTGVSIANLVQAGLSTLSLNGDYNNSVPAPGSLSFIADGLNVTLTGYGFGDSGVFGGSPLDRVGNLDSQPDLALDSVGFFTLNVTNVPEPSSLATVILGILILCSVRWRQNQRGVLRRPRRIADAEIYTSDEALRRWNRDHQPHREKLPP